MTLPAIPGVTLFEYTKIIGIEKIKFGTDVLIDDFVLIYARSPMKIGNHVHIACFTSITGGDEFTMDDFSGVSQGCRILTGTEDPAPLRDPGKIVMSKGLRF